MEWWLAVLFLIGVLVLVAWGYHKAKPFIQDDDHEFKG